MAARYSSPAHNSQHYERVYFDSIGWLKMYEFIYKLNIYRKRED